MFEPEQLRKLFADTLSHIIIQRESAERDLNIVKEQPGFASCLLEMIRSSKYPQEIRQAGAVFFKNHIRRCWPPVDTTLNTQRHVIHPQEKEMIRSMMVEAVCFAPAMIRAQLLTSLGPMIENDFPQEWTSLPNQALSCLSRTEPDIVLGAIQIFYELARKYEYSRGTNKKEFNEIAAGLFPILHALGQTLLTTDDATVRPMMLKMIFKVFFAAVQVDVPMCLRAPEAFRPWLQLLLEALARWPLPGEPVSKPLSPDEDPVDDEERHKSPWWRVKKWALQVLCRILSRYAVPNQSDKDLKPFGRYLCAEAVAPVLQSCVHQLELSRSGAYVAPRVLHLALTILTEAVFHVPMWNQLKPHVLRILTDLTFPFLCHNYQDDLQWEDDPLEFVRTRFDILEDYRNPACAARSFVSELVSKRKKTMLMPVLMFCNELLSKCASSPATKENARRKDGCLNLIGSISSVLERQPDIFAQMETLIVGHVYPEFDSPYAFLRARACWIMSCFSSMPFSDPGNCTRAIRHLMNGLCSLELPVKVYAAIAIQSFIASHDSVRAEIRPHLPKIMNELLRLTHETELDEISSSIKDLIAEFAADLAPFAADICVQLRDSYVRILEASTAENGDDGDSDRMFAAYGLLRAILTLIYSVSGSPQLLDQLEQIMYPVCTVVLQRAVLDQYEEVFEIMACLTYFRKQISPLLWALFPLLCETLKRDGVAYFSDMMPVLDNYVSYGAGVFKQAPPLLEMYVEILRTTISSSDDDLAEEDFANACQLIEALLLHLPGCVDAYLGLFIEMAASLYQKAKCRVLQLTSLDVFLNCLYYNPMLTIQVLEQKGWTNRFFDTIFQQGTLFKRVHDKKLCILSMLLVLKENYATLPATVQAKVPMMFQFMVKVFEALPKAYEDRQKLADQESDDDGDGDEDVDEDEEEDDEDEEETTEQVHGDTNGAITGVGSDDDEDEEDGDDYDYDGLDEIEDDPTAETPIDILDENVIFREIISSLPTLNPQMYAMLTQTHPQFNQMVDMVFKSKDETTRLLQQLQQEKAKA